MSQPVEVYSLFTNYDVSLFRAGKLYKLYEKFGSHVLTVSHVEGVYFSVWAPNARKVSVIGNFNGWNPHSHSLFVRWDGSGIWEGFIPKIGNGEVYKYHIEANSGEILEKVTPMPCNGKYRQVPLLSYLQTGMNGTTRIGCSNDM